MGLPAPLLDTYLRYKKETDAFVTWLATTARSTGKVESVFLTDPTNNNNGSKGWPRGKARKEAKKQAKEYLVPVKSFIILANAITEATNIQVPNAMVEILEDIIRARKECGTFYRHTQANQSEDKMEDDGHKYFIAVLQEIYDLLMARVTKPQSRSPRKVEDDSKTLNNIFEGLDLEEPTHLGTYNSTPAHAQASRPLDTYTIKTSDADIEFAIFCFLKDVTDIRLFIRRTWRLFQQDRVALETAALVMNTGISLIKSLDEAFVKEFPQFKDHEDISDFLFERLGPIDPKFFSAYTDGVQDLSLPTIMSDISRNLLESFVELGLGPADYMFLTKSEVVIAKCLVQIRVLSETLDKDSFYRRDFVFKAVTEVLTTNRTFSWAVFAVQIMLDTQRGLGTDIGRGWSSFRSTAQWISEPLRDYRGHNLDTTKFPIAFPFDIDHFQHLMDVMGKRSARNYSYGHFFLLRHHPLLCGLLSQANLLIFQAGAIAKDRADDAIMSAAHCTMQQCVRGSYLPT